MGLSFLRGLVLNGHQSTSNPKPTILEVLLFFDKPGTCSVSWSEACEAVLRAEVGRAKDRRFMWEEASCKSTSMTDHTKGTPWERLCQHVGFLASLLSRTSSAEVVPRFFCYQSKPKEIALLEPLNCISARLRCPKPSSPMTSPPWRW